MQKSESITALTKALIQVQSALKPAVMNCKNPHFKSKYADLNSIWDSCREVLTKNGLAVIQTNSPAENAVIVETTLAHESGEWICSELMMPLDKHNAQGVGSALTYGRRYGLAAIVGIVADEDDDGNGASGKPNTPANNAKPHQATPEQIKQITAMCAGQKLDMKDFITKKYPDVKASADLLYGEAVELINTLKGAA